MKGLVTILPKLRSAILTALSRNREPLLNPDTGKKEIDGMVAKVSALD
jgi:hypothetical protein